MSMLARLMTPLVGAALVTLSMPFPASAQEAPSAPAEVQPAAAAHGTVQPVSAVPASAPVAAAPMIAPPAAVNAPTVSLPQATPPPPPAPPPVATRTPGRAAQARPAVAAESRRAERSQYVSKGVNIRVDATVTESRGDQVLGRKVVSVTLVDGEDGSVRSSAMVPVSQSNDGPFQRVPLNMDAMMRLRDDNRVHARVTLDYNRGSVEIGESGTQRAARENFIRQSVSVILENGKPLVAAQSADPEGDRRVTLELKATILK